MHLLSLNIDEPSERLILELLEKDAMEQTAEHKGKQRARVLSDGELALQDWTDQLHRSAADLNDHKMALSIAQAVLDDGVALTLAAQEENRAFADRKLAFDLAGLQQPVQEQEPITVHRQALQLINATFSEQVAAQLDEQDETLFENRPNKRRCLAESSRAAEGRKTIAELRPECVACIETKSASDMIHAQCTHWYCKNCITRLVKDALADQSLFPPRCCRVPITLSALRKHIGPELSRRFEERDIEHKDPFRTYCSGAQCAKYIFPPFVQGYVGTCPTCQARTCTLCKRPSHQGPCVDEHLEVMRLAEQSGWKRCPQCRHLIELRTGCNHITCRCRYEFFYVCTLKWKTCRCENWDENRLVERAQLLAGRNVQGTPPQQAVHAAVQRIREGEGCTHHRGWTTIECPGDGDSESWDEEDFECEICSHLHPAPILGIFNKGRRSSPVKTRILDQGFSEMEFLSKPPIQEHAHRPSRRLDDFKMFDYNNGMRNYQVSDGTEPEPRIPIIEAIDGMFQQRPPCSSPNVAHHYKPEINPIADEGAAIVPFSQPSFRGRNTEESYGKPTSFSQAEQDTRSMADLRKEGEAYTKQLLESNIHSPIDYTKKYWTLDDLKSLMQQRISSWGPKDKDSMSRQYAQSHPLSKERKCSPAEESRQIHVQLPLKRGFCEDGQNLEAPLSDKSSVRPATLLGSCSLYGGCIDFPLGQPLPIHGQISHAIEKGGSRPQRPCHDTEGSLFHNEDTSLVCQAFDAAYEAIMLSEQPTPLEVADHTLTEQEIAGNHADTLASHLQTPWKWTTEDGEMLHPSQMRQDMLFDQYRVDGKLDPVRARSCGQQLSYLGGIYPNQENRLYDETHPKLEIGRTLGPHGPEAYMPALGTGPLRNFWRQKKLY
ncbi:hypothetical protein BJX70DRAFT_389348 [Aspergillus crustosus]